VGKEARLRTIMEIKYCATIKACSLVNEKEPIVDIVKTAEISECGKYRWWLQRRWGDGPIVSFVMLNPSTADADKDDPTIRKCIAFAKAWGFGMLDVRNLFPFRATDPKNLTKAANDGIDIRGGKRGLDELKLCVGASLVIAAWGAYPCIARQQEFSLVLNKAMWCIAKNKDGSPVHPLYQALRKTPKPYRNCSGFEGDDGVWQGWQPKK
jgi:hypothetical protein